MELLIEALTQNIVVFQDILKRTGVRVSLSELLDVMSILGEIDISNRRNVKAAMSACLAKSEQEHKLFSEAFDTYFVIPEIKQQYIQEQSVNLQNKRELIETRAEELKFQDQKLDIGEELQEVYANLEEIQRKSIGEFLNKTSGGKNVNADFKAIVESMVTSKLQKLKEERQNGYISSIINIDASGEGIIAAKITEAVRQNEQILHKNIGDLKDEDIPEVILLIREAVNKIRRNMQRKQKLSGKRVAVDLRRTIRKSLNTGGVQFNLIYKNKPKRKEKLLILCDVSASMYRFSGFAVQFIAGLQQAYLSTDVFIFSDHVEHVNVRELTGIDSFEEHVKNSSVWKKGTDISACFEYVLDFSGAVLNSSAIIIILSDGKSIENKKASEQIEKLHKKVKKIVWMNPLPESSWQRIQGMDKYMKSSQMLDCSTLDRLIKACIN